MKALDKHTVQITILNDSRREECEAECGIDWSSPEALSLAGERIKERFGEDVTLVYLDLAKAKDNHDILKWAEVIEKQSLLLPILLVNDQLRISGQFDYRQLMDIIEVEIELGGTDGG